jgi:hypothetical protein
MGCIASKNVASCRWTNGSRPSTIASCVIVCGASNTPSRSGSAKRPASVCMRSAAGVW